MLWDGESVTNGAIPLADVLLLGTAEWDAPIATNQHYVARELSRAADVTFVESLGLRRPTLRRDDVVRMASRVRRAFAGQPAVAHRPRPERTRVVSPLVVPVHRAPTRPLNRALLHRATAGWLRSARPRVLWTFTPVTYGLEASADIVVYHCVDLLGTVPGVDSVAVEHGERRLAARSPLAVATSTAVADHLAALGFARVILLPNVADVSVFAAAGRPAAQRRPAVLFSGNLTGHKLDVALLESVASSGIDLVLAGPVAAGFEEPLRRLESRGARHVGLLSPEQLADLAGTCSVGLIPYALNDYTRGVSPLKCFEYLASGLAVLSTRIPAVEELARDNPHVVTADPGQFRARLTRLLDPVTDEAIADRRASAATQGWHERGRVLRELLATELAATRG
jgi:glycosyltransferase involved in cell wall biosynthesis